MKHLYLGLCFVGAALPLWQFYPFLLEHGLHLGMFFEQLFASPVSGFFGLDVIVSAVALISYILVESKRLQLKQGYWALAGLCIGVSLALPLFLYLKQRHLDIHSTMA